MLESLSLMLMMRKPKGSGKAGGSADPKQKACKYWFSKGGCKWGQKCRYLHEPPVTKDSGRCYRCSGEGHSKSMCPYKEAGGGKSSSEAVRAEVPGAKAKGKAAARKAQAAEPGVGSESTPGAGTAPDAMASASSSQAPSVGGQSQAQAELLREATEPLSSLALRAMRKAKKWVKEELDVRGSAVEGGLCPPGMVLKVTPQEGGKTGLLDSGASVCLRTGTVKELKECEQKEVTLAVGSAHMKVNRQGTALVEGPVSPIVSLGLLVRVGCQLLWTANGVQLKDKKGRKIAVSLDGGCPEVDHDCAIRMIEEIEQHLHQAQVAKEQVRELKAKGFDLPPDDLLRIIREKSAQGQDTLGLVRLWLEKMFPEAPVDLLDRVAAAPETDGAKSPWNRRKRRALLKAKQGVLINLFAGCSRERFRSVADKNHMALLDIDLDEDLSLDTTFSYLLALAIQGRVKILLAGPPCRTLSVCRTYPGGPPIVRDRLGPGRWGRANISGTESMKVEGDNVLILRTMALGIVAKLSNDDLRTGDFTFRPQTYLHSSPCLSGMCLRGILD